MEVVLSNFNMLVINATVIDDTAADDLWSDKSCKVLTWIISDFFQGAH